MSGLWSEFEQFFLKYSLYFWSPARVDLPYGQFLVFHPEDDASMLYAADLNNGNNREIIQEVEKLAAFWDVPPGFYISPSWKGNVSGFIEDLEQHDYALSHKMIVHLIDNIDGLKFKACGDFTIEKTNDINLVKAIFQEGFECSSDFADLLDRYVQPRTGISINSQFFLARDKSGTPAGIAACAYDHQFGYLNCLSVKKSFRGQGCASQLVEARLNHLLENNVNRAVTNVAWKNTPSLKTQEKIGYRRWVEVSVWKKNNTESKKI